MKAKRRFRLWNPGPCPVSGETPVQVIFRDGYISAAFRADDWGPQEENGDCWWNHEGEEPGDNIMAYRIVEPEELI